MPRVFILVFVLVHLVLFLFYKATYPAVSFLFFWGFLFLFGSVNCTSTICQTEFERLMCEVEFWEVF